MTEIDLEKLLTKLDKSSFTSFEMTEGDFSIKVKKETTQVVQPVATVNAVATNVEATSEIADANLEEIKAPFVGVVYFAPSEGEDPYIKVGSHISKGDTVGLIEAMKMFNEVHSPVDGEIVELLVENGSMVEYDQPIARVRKVGDN
ncbi:acetyl-CoA carboxylase biotin carboxyl carrier protein subunit [Pediococcus pentosaceus]|uniref:acetyl-CoA carboxylase biotin carboxyl carrier protein n=1 Tax=Pediococcus pentosaceus TaxID=1255 RepID=UPI001330523E|nr:biotin/lipoyl-containing protein [Pediococcus pentosaceus]KAF0506284.1 acetyl-CoA carboxylase biotin carboxyl carrier protein subunit [Pediococcus pentosaceus]MBF7139886.1 acetyl-CoA carboxylase biotin carboxyl carrier protein subunit [Pediococcus pentosaceus]